jgi:UDP-N-acetylglucosamine:LPS N-acetylglucosamine transferase
MTRRVLAMASGGGPWAELRRIQEAFDGFDVAYVGVYKEYAEEVRPYRFHLVFDVSSLRQWRSLRLFFRLFLILLKERPNVVVVTGDFSSLMMLVLAKVIFRSKTIWIDSIANCDRVSSSGLYAKRYSDIFLTQWRHLAHCDDPRISSGYPEHWGAVI